MLTWVSVTPLQKYQSFYGIFSAKRDGGWHQWLIRSQNKGQTVHCLFILMLWLQATYHLIFYKHKELVPGLCCFLGPAGFEEFLKSGHQSGLHWLEAKTRVSFWILKYTMFRYHKKKSVGKIETEGLLPKSFGLVKTLMESKPESNFIFRVNRPIIKSIAILLMKSQTRNVCKFNCKSDPFHNFIYFRCLLYATQM